MATFRIGPALLAALLLLAWSGCSADPEPVCPKGQRQCADGVCRECCADGDCWIDEVCSDFGRCETDGHPHCLGFECWPGDRDACCSMAVCDSFELVCVLPCASDEDCRESHPTVAFGDFLRCQAGGTCTFGICNFDFDCPEGEFCYNGDCIGWGCDDGHLSRCIVSPRSAVTRTGTTVRLSATALLASGALAPGINFRWTSWPETIASVDRGLVTGGIETGTATITATVTGCQTTCSAEVRNYGPVAAGVRVVVIDELTGAPMEGATVDIEGVGSELTDATGVAAFPGADLAASSATLTISGAEIGYLSFMQADSNDLIAHLGRLPDPNLAGGYRGKFDFSKIICDPGNPCEVKIGLTGVSIPGNPFNLDLDSLIGELFMTHIELGDTAKDVHLPGGLVIGLNDTWFRPNYEATGTPGTRVAWGLGGKLNLADLIDVFGPVISGGDLDIGAVVRGVLHMFASLYTSLVPNLEIEPIPKVADLNDLNGDGDTTDLVPDYANFPALPGGDMVLKVPMDQTLTISVPALPSDGAGGFLFDGLIVLAGVMVRDAGLVPLGLSAGMDAPTAADTPDGDIAAISLSVSDVAGRLPEGSYQRLVVALALDTAKLTDSNNTDPLVIAGQVHFVDSFSGGLALNALMSPAAYTYDPMARAVDLTSVAADADVVLMLGSSEAGTWQVFHPALAGLINLPAVPAAGDRFDRVGLAALKFAGNLSYSDLIAFNDTNLIDLVLLVSDFVMVLGSGHGPARGP